MANVPPGGSTSIHNTLTKNCRDSSWLLLNGYITTAPGSTTTPDPSAYYIQACDGLWYKGTKKAGTLKALGISGATNPLNPGQPLDTSQMGHGPCAYSWTLPNLDLASNLPLVGRLAPKIQPTICFDPIVGGLKLFVGVGAMLVLAVLLIILLSRGSGVARVAGVTASAAGGLSPTRRAANRARVRAPIERERRAQETHEQRTRLREASADRSFARSNRRDTPGIGRNQGSSNDPQLDELRRRAREKADRERSTDTPPF